MAEHKCDRNYEGSAPNMEVHGTKTIFSRSVQARKLRYTGYIADGDTKSCEAVKKENYYGENYEVTKKECVGHVQRRVGNQLRKLKITTGKTKLADGKTLGGKGRLTKKEIDKLQIYYGLAIRRNIGNLEGMKNDINAILRHRLSTDSYPNHSKCPKGEETWCKFRTDKITLCHARLFKWF